MISAPCFSFLKNFKLPFLPFIDEADFSLKEGNLILRTSMSTILLVISPLKTVWFSVDPSALVDRFLKGFSTLIKTTKFCFVQNFCCGLFVLVMYGRGGFLKIIFENNHNDLIFCLFIFVLLCQFRNQSKKKPMLCTLRAFS